MKQIWATKAISYFWKTLYFNCHSLKYCNFNWQSWKYRYCSCCYCKMYNTVWLLVTYVYSSWRDSRVPNHLRDEDILLELGTRLQVLLQSREQTYRHTTLYFSRSRLLNRNRIGGVCLSKHIIFREKYFRFSSHFALPNKSLMFAVLFCHVLAVLHGYLCLTWQLFLFPFNKVNNCPTFLTMYRDLHNVLAHVLTNISYISLP